MLQERELPIGVPIGSLTEANVFISPDTDDVPVLLEGVETLEAMVGTARIRYEPAERRYWAQVRFDPKLIRYRGGRIARIEDCQLSLAGVQVVGTNQIMTRSVTLLLPRP